MNDQRNLRASEEGIEPKPSADRAASSWLIRLIGFLVFLFGLPYIIQGVNLIISLDPERYSFFIIQIQMGLIGLDFLIGGGSLFIGIGLFFQKEWARKAWLVFLILLLLAHFFVIVLLTAVGNPAGPALYKWIGVVILVSIISWAYLSRAFVKASFH